MCKRLGVDIWAGRENFLIDCLGSDNLFWTPHQSEPLLGISRSISDKRECRHYLQEDVVSRRIHYTNYCTAVLLLVGYKYEVQRASC